MHLCRLYKIEPLYFSDFVYPLNISKCIAYLKAEMDFRAEDLQLMVLEDETHRATLATVKIFDTKTTLYYLPLEPLYRLLRDRERRAVADLLLSVTACFYQYGKIPSHADCCSYLNDTYSMIGEWILENEEEEDKAYRRHQLSYIKKMDRQSHSILKRLKQKKPLSDFKKRMMAFCPSDKVEEDLLALAQKAYSMFGTFPERTVMDKIIDDFDAEEEQEERIRIDQYLSFIWSRNDCLYDTLMETVNSALQEYNWIDEPMDIQFFDLPQEKQTHDLLFEETFFDLLNDLTDTLIDFEHEKH
ncbi:hypothetical protein ACFOG5_00285 [Pedobacter fastidiosus]|uniref:Uncharacterized protein n=2 Tax=Pedobacter fastidiosus TaxID=2765361 RepID=A0ABR7KYK1_9SPHI|nr:hypothetical protein [Pedobacter fastidiosus]